MELRIPTHKQLKEVYNADLKESFPPAELKSLASIERMWADGCYHPWCLHDDDGMGPIGCAFLWLGRPGWALLDYLCVNVGWRNDGFGAEMLKLLPETEPGRVILCESEEPTDAPDPAMAKRRLGFYERCGMRTAGFDAEVFGVHYKILYLADREISDEEVMAEYRFVYESVFTPKKFARYIRIPYDPAEGPGKKVDWDQ